MSNSTSLHLRALNKYQEGGLISLMGVAKNKFKPDIKRIILNSLIMNRDQLTSYAESEESLWRYGSETTFDISPPISGDSPPEFEPYIGINHTSQQFVCELSDVTLIGKYAIPQTNRGYYVLEEMSNEWTMQKLLSQSFDSDVRVGYETLRQYRSATNNTDYEVLINLVPRHFDNYGHCRRSSPVARSASLSTSDRSDSRYLD